MELVEKAADPPATAVDDSAPEFRHRLQSTEREVERALIDLASLKADLATLVGAVDDIKKKMSHQAPSPAGIIERPRRKLAGPRAIAAVLILLTGGVALWGFVSVAPDDPTEPPPPVVETPRPVEAPPIVDTAPVVEIAPAVRKDPPAPPAPVVAKTSVARPTRTVTYVGTLMVDAEPAGDVYLNRKNVGRSPVRLENLRAGSHLIWIEREGYRRWTRVVAVAADRTARVSASLDPLSR